MGKRRLTTVVVGLILAMVASTGLADAVTNAADKLVDDQLQSPPSTEELKGSWPDEADVAGEPTIGLCHAYELTNNPAYKTAAVAAGHYSLASAGYDPGAGSSVSGLLHLPEAYAMARLSAIDDNPASNFWRTALVANLDAVDPAGTIASYGTSGDEDGTAVYEVARMAVAADYVKGELTYPADPASWRNGVISLLGDFDLDLVYCPTKALGAAVWALASTGDIKTDNTVVWTGGTIFPDDVLVKDLPGLLAGMQADDGSFYAFLDYYDGYSGFTESTVMATLGLQAADPNFYSSEIADAVSVLEGGVAESGAVYWEIGESGSSIPGGGVFDAGIAGETLEVIPEPATMSLLLVGAVGMIRRRRSK